LERVQERVESDFTPEELQRLIDEANQEIIDRYGEHTDPPTPITVQIEGCRRKVGLIRPLDVAATPAPVVKEYTGSEGLGEVETTLADDDYRVWNDGRTLERISSGTNPGLTANGYWGHRVQITYMPQNDGNQRQEVIIKLCQLAVEYKGVWGRAVGDVDNEYYTYTQERERLLRSLSPRKGLMIA
jgi:hypothetical protein